MIYAEVALASILPDPHSRDGRRFYTFFNDSPDCEACLGSLQGVAVPEGAAIVFGVPYATPPVGDLRWKPCLYLNICPPGFRQGSLPVIVFFHGGSNTAGYSSFTPLGPPFARLGVVMVTANYRLRPFGFFVHPALTAESPHHTSGNYGLLDQI